MDGCWKTAPPCVVTDPQLQITTRLIPLATSVRCKDGMATWCPCCGYLAVPDSSRQAALARASLSTPGPFGQPFGYALHSVSDPSSSLLGLAGPQPGSRGSVCHQIHAVRLGRLRAEGQPLTHLVGHVPRNPHLGCPLRRPDVFYLTKTTFRKLEAIGALLASVVSVFRQTDLLHTSERMSLTSSHTCQSKRRPSLLRPGWPRFSLPRPVVVTSWLCPLPHFPTRVPLTCCSSSFPTGVVQVLCLHP